MGDEDIRDLQSGTQYASTTVDSSSDGTWVDFYLNSDALIDIWNNQGGMFAVGAKSEDNNAMFTAPGGETLGIDALLHPNAQLKFNFKNSVAFAQAAGVAVPEPSTYGLAGGFLLTIAIAIRHQRRRKAIAKFN